MPVQNMIMLTRARKLCQCSTWSSRALEGGESQVMPPPPRGLHNATSHRALLPSPQLPQSSPGVVLAQGHSNATDAMGGLHVPTLHCLAQLILQSQHQRDEFQECVHIPGGKRRGHPSELPAHRSPSVKEKYILPVFRQRPPPHLKSKAKQRSGPTGQLRRCRVRKNLRSETSKRTLERKCEVSVMG